MKSSELITALTATGSDGNVHFKGLVVLGDNEYTLTASVDEVTVTDDIVRLGTERFSVTAKKRK